MFLFCHIVTNLIFFMTYITSSASSVGSSGEAEGKRAYWDTAILFKDRWEIFQRERRQAGIPDEGSFRHQGY